MNLKITSIFYLLIFFTLTLSGCNKSGEEIPAGNKDIASNKQLMKFNLYKFDKNFNQVANKFLDEELHNFSHGYESVFSSYLNIKDSTSKEISETYNENQVDGDQKFYKKNIRIKGRLASINSGFGNQPYLVFSDGGFNRPQAKLAEGLVSEAAALKKNQEITLVCVGDGSIAGTPMLSECYFANHVGNFARSKMIHEIEGFAKGEDAAKEAVQIAVISETIARLINDDMECTDECIAKMAKMVTFGNSSAVMKNMISSGLKARESYISDSK